MRHLGIAVGQARLPMGPAPDFVERRAPEVLANLQRWRDAFPERPEPLSCAESVRIVFLGGWARSAATAWRSSRASGDRRSILLIDCGLMFPDADMHGIDLVLPDFTLPPRSRRRRSPGWWPRTATRTTSAASSSCCATATASATCATAAAGLRRGADARPGPSPHRGGRPARPGRACGRSPTTRRSRSAPFEVEFIPVTHSVPHAHAIAVHTSQGVVLHSGDWKLDLTPVDGRRTDLARLGQLTAGNGRAAADGRLHQRRGAGLRAERAVGRRRAAFAVRPAPRAADHHRQLRQPPAPHPADRRRRRRGRPQDRHARAEHEEERPARPRPRRAARSPTRR